MTLVEEMHLTSCSSHTDYHLSCLHQRGRDGCLSSSPHSNSWRLTHQDKIRWDQNPAGPGKENTLASSGCEESFAAYTEVDQSAQDEQSICYQVDPASNKITVCLFPLRDPCLILTSTFADHFKSLQETESWFSNNFRDSTHLHRK